MKNRTERYENEHTPNGRDESRPHMLNWVFVSALFLLLVNDFYLKTAFPSFLSGKLSDLSGLIVFSLFFTFLFGNRFKGIIFIITTLLFCWWKSALSNDFITQWNSFFPFYPIERVVDYSDLFCLGILIPVYFYRPKALSFLKKQWLAAPVLLLTVFAIGATSKAKNIGAYTNTRKYIIQESFKIKKVTYTEFLQHLSLSNMTVEKNTNEIPPSKPNDYHYYILRNFEIMDGITVESMRIGVKEKNENLKILIQDVNLFDPPAKSDKEMKKMLMELFEDFFAMGS